MFNIETLLILVPAMPLLAALVTARIYPIYLPESATLPAITYQIISKSDVNTADGPVGLVTQRIQFTCFATTYIDAIALATAVRAAIGGYSGTTGSIVFRSILLTDQGDIPMISPDSDSHRRYGRRVDFEIWNEE